MEISKIKKVFIYLCLVLFAFYQVNPCLALDSSADSSSGKYLLHGQAEINQDKTPKKNIFTGETTEVKKGTSLKMTVSSVLSSGYTEEGDEFFAEVTNDLAVKGGVLIPSGTIAHGKVNGLTGSKRLGRDGFITLKFDYLITPDGREIPIQAEMTSKRNPVASVAKVALEDTAYTVAGGVVGGILAFKYLGLGAAVASHGYTIAGGAGIGAVVGVGMSLARKGQDVLIAPGDEINVNVAGTLNLPVISEEALKEDEQQYPGLTVNITDYKIEKDPFGEPNTITLGLDVKNNSDKSFSSFDMALVNDYKAVYYASPFGNTDMWFQKITPNSHVSGKISFSVDSTKRKHWLVFYDTYTRKTLASISVNNAAKQLKKQKK